MKIGGEWLSSPATQAVFDALARAGIEAFFVGGCVRNAAMGVAVTDLDLTTAARPDAVMQAAEDAGLKVVPTGIDHGTVTVVADGAPYEITTFRHDVETDGRHAKVAFSTSMEEDARRRDFTFNALYADRDGTVFDPLGGLPDLDARRVRFIGDAASRIAEDYLRILRFFRFHAWYGDVDRGLDQDSLAACAAGADGLAQLSGERIGAEMTKLLQARDPAPSVAAMAQAGILARIMPGADAKGLSVLIHLEDGLPPHMQRRAAILGGASLKERWRLSNAVAQEIDALRDAIGSSAGLAEIAYRHGADFARDTMLLRAATFEQPAVGDAEIAKGAGAQFPIRAQDLMPELQGAALGAKLKELEAAWIASGFTATKGMLL